jgi:predicted AlkP superfamily pyrophosphatase or phosphodiesterase
MLLLISFDGTRPDALSPERTPNIDAVRRRGAATMQARSVMPTMTLPCHTSVFHSVPPERHGITSNVWSPLARPLPGIIEVAVAGGKRCGAIYNWEQLRDLSRPGNLEYSWCLNTGELDMASDEAVADAALGYLVSAAPDFAFVYFGTIDTAGHRDGWMSEGYLNQLNAVDQAFGRLLAALPADTTLLLMSDHGGHERTHGTDRAEDMTIPLIVAGPTIRAGYTIGRETGLLDIAPTIAHLLDLAPAPAWEGRIIDEAIIR